jgi:hypothetical protein
MCDYICENPNIKSLKEILPDVVSKFNLPLIAEPMLERYLHMKVITWKKLQIMPYSRNSMETKEKEKNMRPGC